MKRRRPRWVWRLVLALETDWIHHRWSDYGNTYKGIDQVTMKYSKRMRNYRHP